MNPIDEYISGFPNEIQPILEKVRNAIKKAAPDAEECVSWGMPTFKQNGNVVHFAGYKNHVGFYPGASGIEAFKDKISNYKNSKGAVQFPLNKPIPSSLITQIVKFRVNENLKSTKSNTKNDFLFALSARARWTLEDEKITTLKKLSQYSESEISKLHGIGGNAIFKLKKALEKKGLQFRDEI